MRRQAFVLVCALFVAVGLLVAAALPPPVRGEDTVPRIEEFAGIPWEASKEEIVEEYGEPDLTKPVLPVGVSSGSTLIYGDQSLLDEDASIVFLLHPEGGLAKGMYAVEWEETILCETVFEKVRDAIEEQYPSLDRDEERRVNRSDYLAFCESVELGKAGRGIKWEKSRNRVQIGVAIYPGDDYVMVHYETEKFHEWKSKAFEEKKKEMF